MVWTKLIISSTVFGANTCLVLIDTFVVKNNFKSSISLTVISINLGATVKILHPLFKGFRTATTVTIFMDGWNQLKLL